MEASVRPGRMQAFTCFGRQGPKFPSMCVGWDDPSGSPRSSSSAQYSDLLVHVSTWPNPHDIDSLLGLVQPDQGSIGANAQTAFRAAVKRFGDQWIKRQRAERRHNAILIRRAEPSQVATGIAQHADLPVSHRGVRAGRRAPCPVARRGRRR